MKVFTWDIFFNGRMCLCEQDNANSLQWRTNVSVSLRHTNTHTQMSRRFTLFVKESPRSVKWGWWDVWHCIPITIYFFLLIFQFLSMENIPGVKKDWVMSSFARFDRVLNYNIQSPFTKEHAWHFYVLGKVINPVMVKY